MRKIIVALCILGLLASSAIAITEPSNNIEEEVIEFKNWFGVIYNNQKQIITFSYTDQATIYIKMDSNQNLIMEIFTGVSVEPISIKNIWIDDNETPITIDYKITQHFVKGRMARIELADSNIHKFSLYGFTRAYRWLAR
jgi:hypothetical protein